MIEVLSTSVPLAAMFLQARWGTTPGKRLFQLRIVDSHGLPLSRSLLAFRMAFQFIPIWIMPITGVLEVFGLVLLSSVVQLAAVVFITVDAGFALFFPQGKSVHDLLLGTRVVIDT